MKIISEYEINISYIKLVIFAYLYMILPIVIFLCGWIKPFIGIPATFLLLYSFYRNIKDNYRLDEKIQVKIVPLFFLVLGLYIWVYTSGIGGFWPQKADWHWRNALFRDLINFSWPVVYPETNNALVYYFNYFLPAALVGKILGWNIANICLALFTTIGIILSALLVYKCVCSNQKRYISLFAILVFFVVWQGMECLRYGIINLFELNVVKNYEFSSNNTLLQWVPNQSIVPWIAIPLFLQNKKISTYIFLGMCVFASAPFPFIGFFVLLAGEGLFQLFRCNDYKNWLKQVFSISNVGAFFSVFIIYGFFYLCNTAANGSSNIGGIGFYFPITNFSIKDILQYLTFIFFNAIGYSLLIFKRFKKDPVFWIINISFIVIPIIRIGTGNDFGMRASIPAMFILMIYTLDYFTSVDCKNIKLYILIGLIAISCQNTYNDYISRFELIYKNNGNVSTMLQDGIITFSNKINNADYCGMKPVNFLANNYESTLFYKYIAKSKTNMEKSLDSKVVKDFLRENEFNLISGSYLIRNKTNQSNYLSSDESNLKLSSNPDVNIAISNTTMGRGKYEIYMVNFGKVLVGSSSSGETATIDSSDQIWGISEINDHQLVDILPADENYYFIIFNDRYALSLVDHNVKWEKIMYTDNQKWNFTLR